MPQPRKKATEAATPAKSAARAAGERAVADLSKVITGDAPPTKTTTLVGKYQEEIAERMAILKPAVEEYNVLAAAAAVLGGDIPLDRIAEAATPRRGRPRAS